MKLEHLAVGCLGIGAGLVTLAICLDYLILPAVPANASWSREEARALERASLDYHAKSFDASVTDEELAASAAEYQAHEDKLNAAKSSRRNLPRYCQYGGIAFAVVGTAFYIAARAKSDD